MADNGSLRENMLVLGEVTGRATGGFVPGRAVSRIMSPAGSLERRAGHYAFKRLADLLVAAVGLVLLAPLLIVLWALVVTTSKGPGVHWSQRVGRHGSTFWMPKFRTMHCMTPHCAREAFSELEASLYVTPLGRVLRRSGLDELPQLWCILIGQMSLVGPRPAMLQDPTVVARARFPAVSRARPGLTGLAQIVGRNRVPSSKKARLDAYYVRRCNPFGDIKILALTIVVLVTGRGFL